MALWVEDEEGQNQAGSLFDPVEMQQDGDGALPGLGDRQPDGGMDGKAEVVQNHPAVGLGCAEMVEGCSAAPLHPQEVLEDYAAAPADPDVGVAGRKGCLLIQTGLVQTVGLDLVVQDEAQQNRVGPLWILPDMVQEDHMGLLAPGEEGRDYDGALPAAMDTRDLWDAAVALKSPAGLEHEGGWRLCGLHLLAVKC